jgi:hypothetical protein
MAFWHGLRSASDTEKQRRPASWGCSVYVLAYIAGTSIPPSMVPPARYLSTCCVKLCGAAMHGGSAAVCMLHDVCWLLVIMHSAFCRDLNWVFCGQKYLRVVVRGCAAMQAEFQQSIGCHDGQVAQREPEVLRRANVSLSCVLPNVSMSVLGAVRRSSADWFMASSKII